MFLLHELVLSIFVFEFPRILDKRRLVLQVGPSTFFSSKQFEVFDVELISIQNCQRRTVLAFYSDFVCQ